MDEADRLLDRDDGDFTDDIAEIMAKLPPREKRQTLMYSATLSETIEEARSMATTGLGVKTLIQLKLPKLHQKAFYPFLHRTILLAKRRAW